MTIRNYSQQDTSIVKGFAILCICLHNFFHWIAPYTGENELYFSEEYVINFFDRIAESPAEFINIIFTFLGHYGVQIFIFISGLGLTLSMLKKSKTWLSFIVDRLKKLYPLIITALIFYILFTITMDSKLPNENQFKELGYKLLFIHTLLPYQGLTLNGPWWFFGLIFQLYLIFPFLFHIIKRYNTKGFIAICIFSYTWTFISQYLFQDIFEVYYLQNFPGHLPEFCIGIWLALNSDKKINNIFFFLALILFCLSNYYKIFFPFSFLSVTVISIFAYQFFKNIPIQKTLLKKFLIYFGSISMTLFAVHGFLRYPFVQLSNNILNTPLGHICSATLFMTFAIIIALSANHVYDFLLSLFNRIRLPEKQGKLSIIITRFIQVALFIFSIYILAHFIRQNNYDNMDKIHTYESVENVSITDQQEYHDIVNIKIDERGKKIKIEGSFDLKNNDIDSDLPFLVLDINGLLWEKIDIPTKSNTSDFESINFDYEYCCPFINNLKGRTIKLYFWNNNKSSFEYQNMTLSISTK